MDKLTTSSSLRFADNLWPFVFKKKRKNDVRMKFMGKRFGIVKKNCDICSKILKLL